MGAGAKVIVIFVHGAWHNPKSFTRVMLPLEGQGVVTRCPALPTDSADHTSEALDDDVAVVRVEIARAADEGADVVVCMHGYGGIPGTQAVEGLSKAARQQQGKPGGVVHLIYLAAFVLPAGAPFSTLNGLLPNTTIFHADGSCEAKDPEHFLYGDLSPQEQAHWARQLKPKASAAFLGSGPSYAGWLDVPSSYLFCLNDKAAPLAAQLHMVRGAHAAGAKMQLFTCSAGHSPMLSQPDLVVSVVERAIATVQAA